MSRIGKQLIPVPDSVKAEIDAHDISITGPRGTLTMRLHPLIAVELKDQAITCTVKRPTKQTPALWGTTRARIANMVTGVQTGFRKQLELHGVGYRAQLKGKNLELALGFSHPVLVEAPPDVTFTVEKDLITVEGTDKVVVGQVAADIRKVRPPEPYKGKGVRYVGEQVRRKVGKVVGTTTG